MPRTIGRKLLWAYALLMIVTALGYARYDAYMMDGDGTAFLDIAQGLDTHHAGLAINSYWNPGYPAVLAVAEEISHPSLWNELALVRYTNVVIFMLTMGACVFFTTGLTGTRSREPEESSRFAVPPAAVHMLGLALLMLSLERELPVAAPRADTLLLAFLLAAAGLLVRILCAAGNLTSYMGLGLVLGFAYLTKSFAFLPSAALLLALLVRSVRQPGAVRKGALAGTILASALFALTAGPYVLAISRQLGHFSTGESARLNYAFFIDMTPRWHEWFRHDLGHASGPFLHPEAVLNAQPPVFSYSAHPDGTFPLWFDPAWWTAGLKPHIWLKGHVLRLARNFVVFFRYLLGRPEVFVLLAVLLSFGCGLPRLLRQTTRKEPRAWWAMAPILWGSLMFLIYLPVDLQDRYLTAPLLLIVLPLFACLRVRQGAGVSRLDDQRSPALLDYAPLVANAVVLLFAGVALSQSATYLADRRRHIPPAEQHHAGFDPQIFTAAAALARLGVRPGDKVACMGDLACYTDFYWARLSGAQILGEVETPGEANPATVWHNIADKRAVTEPLARMGLRYIVSLFPNSARKPDGWIQLGGSNFFAFPLQGSVDSATASEIATFSPTP